MGALITISFEVLMPTSGFSRPYILGFGKQKNYGAGLD